MRVNGAPALFLLFVLALLGLLSCSSTDDGGTDIPNKIVAGRVVDTVGAPVARAYVRLFHGRDSSVRAPDPLVTARTDADGYFTLRVPAGRYHVEGRSADSGLILLRADLEATVPSETLKIEMPLVRAASLQGRFEMADRKPARALLAGTPYFAPVDAEGGFRFGSLPPGRYELVIGLLDSLGLPVTAIAWDSITLASDSLTDAGVLKSRNLVPDTGIFMVDDFEDGDFWSRLGTRWWFFDDYRTGGVSDVFGVGRDSSEVDSVGEGGNRYALHARFRLAAPMPRYFGMGTHLGLAPAAGLSRSFDISAVRAISFEVKGISTGKINLTAIWVSESPGEKSTHLHRMDSLSGAWESVFIGLPPPDSLNPSLLPPIDPARLGPDSLAAPALPAGPVLPRYASRLVFIVAGDIGEGDLWLDRLVFHMKEDF